MTKRDLLCVLLGVVLALSALFARGIVLRQEQLDLRVQHIEQFLNAVISQAGGPQGMAAANR